jgi:YggT family protein
MTGGGIVGGYIQYFVSILFTTLYVAIIVRSLMSWFNPSPDNPLVRFVYEITEPVLAPLRRIVPRIGMIDITPIVAIVLLQIIENVLSQVLRGV